MVQKNLDRLDVIGMHGPHQGRLLRRFVGCIYRRSLFEQRLEISTEFPRTAIISSASPAWPDALGLAPAARRRSVMSAFPFVTA